MCVQSFLNHLMPTGDHSSSYVNTLKNSKCRPPIGAQKRPAESPESLNGKKTYFAANYRFSSERATIAPFSPHLNTLTEY